MFLIVIVNEGNDVNTYQVSWRGDLHVTGIRTQDQVWVLQAMLEQLGKKYVEDETQSS